MHDRWHLGCSYICRLPQLSRWVVSVADCVITSPYMESQQSELINQKMCPLKTKLLNIYIILMNDSPFTSLLDYCNCLNSGLEQLSLRRLQLEQNAAAQKRNPDHITPVHGLCSLASCHSGFILTFYCLFLGFILQFHWVVAPLILHHQQVDQPAASGGLYQPFAVAAPNLCNLLSIHITTAETLQMFDIIAKDPHLLTGFPFKFETLI